MQRRCMQREARLCIVYISQYNNCVGLMVSEYNYKMYLLMYSRVILYVIFFQCFQVLCAVSLIKNAFVYLCVLILFKVVGPRASHPITNVFVISVI